MDFLWLPVFTFDEIVLAFLLGAGAGAALMEAASRVPQKPPRDPKAAPYYKGPSPLDYWP